ncbi:hypothetical protein E0H26_04520 [Micromonospora zingiberis]|uniref:PPE domain-containing protein n=1 Tax=Micromonospora zingiberis TaxID=2053011 RepID=A0A4R0GPY3_9ACTN|nr:hypothetical protein [Micromonospora zingiberis]TCB99814.1 hypothetical protein E0H26_04520 [Micromonospora zingiberis]
MRDVGVGRSGGLTDWYLMNVADMWACVQDHHTEQHWRHVAGWRKVCDLAGQHLTRLRAYRDGLARAWPPETNAAARAYVTELDDLIKQVQRTHDAAAANQTALSAATQAITSTRAELKKIYEEYAGKLQQKRAWDQTAADPKAAAGSRTSQPPVTDADLERLNIQARGIMYGLSSELQQAQTMLRQPPPPTRIQSARDQPSPEGHASGGNAAPIIPPIVPMPLTSSAGTTPARSPSLPTRPVFQTDQPRVGPVLGRTQPALLPANPPAAADRQKLPSSPGPTAQSSPLGVQPPILGPGQTPSGQIGRSNGVSPNTTPRPMQHGGLIGGVPASAPSRAAASGGEPRRINPIGGIIGGGGAGTTPKGAAGSRPGIGRGISGSHMMPPPIFSPSNSGTSIPASKGSTVSRTDQHKDDPEKPRRWDPDHPWETDKGVSPVVRPPDDGGPIDPGPAIGIDR